MMNLDDRRTRMPAKLRMCHINIQSLNPGEPGLTTRANYKLDQMRTVLQLEHHFDVIGVSETWLMAKHTDEQIALDNYDIHRKDRDTHAGGVCVYVNSILPNKRRDDLEDPLLEIVWIEISRDPKPILIGVAYRRPGMDRDSAANYIQKFQDMMMKVMNTNADAIYLMGDFNDPCTTWEGRHPQSELKEQLLDSTTTLGLHQLINVPTHRTDTSANILDLIFTDSPGHVTMTGTLPPIGTTRHEVIFCETTTVVPKLKPFKKEVWKYDQADREGLNIAIGDFPFEELLPNDPNQAVDIWTLFIMQIAREYIPCITITVRPQDKPWMTQPISRLIKTRNRLYRRATG